MKRTIKLNGLNKELELGKVSMIKTSKKEFIYLEKMKDGKWILNYTEDTIPEIKELKSMEIIRED